MLVDQGGWSQHVLGHHCPFVALGCHLRLWSLSVVSLSRDVNVPSTDGLNSYCQGVPHGHAYAPSQDSGSDQFGAKLTTATASAGATQQQGPRQYSFRDATLQEEL